MLEYIDDTRIIKLKTMMELILISANSKLYDRID